VEELYPLFPLGDISSIFTFLSDRLLQKKTEEAERRWYADQFILLLRQQLSHLQQQPEIILACLNFFCRHGFFASAPLSKSDQSMLREKLFSLLSVLISNPEEVWASVAVLQIEKLEADNKKVIKLDSEIKKIRKSGIKLMKKLRALVPTPPSIILMIEEEKSIATVSRIGDALRFDVAAIVQWRSRSSFSSGSIYFQVLLELT
jgi:DNA polymerase phi